MESARWDGGSDEDAAVRLERKQRRDPLGAGYEHAAERERVAHRKSGGEAVRVVRHEPAERCQPRQRSATRPRRFLKRSRLQKVRARMTEPSHQRRGWTRRRRWLGSKVLRRLPILLDLLVLAAAGILQSFDVTATYDKANRRLQLAATVMPELVAHHEKSDRPRGRSRDFEIAGAGFGHQSATGYRFMERRDLP